MRRAVKKKALTQSWLRLIKKRQKKSQKNVDIGNLVSAEEREVPNPQPGPSNASTYKYFCPGSPLSLLPHLMNATAAAPVEQYARER